MLSTVATLMDDPATPAELLPSLILVRQHVERALRLIEGLLDASLVLQDRTRPDREGCDDEA